MFDPTGIAGLSEEAAVLEPAELTFQARLAERLLRVAPEAYDTLPADAQAVWQEMVLLQIRYQMQANPALVRQGVGDLQQTYRDGGPVSPGARLLRDTAFADGADTPISNGSWGLDAVYDSDAES